MNGSLPMWHKRRNFIGSHMQPPPVARNQPGQGMHILGLGLGLLKPSYSETC